ncbi:MAG: hypothetical protein F7C81_01180 [Desulfurococcales archaeon]|nr:hypothetical protein [Desulfurococcales archaeon]
MNGVEELRSKYLRYNALAGFLLLVTGVTAFASSSNFKSHFLFMGIITALFMGLNVARLAVCRGCNEKRLGEIAVQGGWLWTSFSLAFLSLAPAKIYGLPTVSLAVVELLSVFLLLSGAYFLFLVKRETGVALSV